MIDMDLVEETIEELENRPTNFDTCAKLASLYIIREQNKNANLSRNTNVQSQVTKELNDILPGYEAYVQKKLQFQMGEIGIEAVTTSFKTLVTEVSEFLHILYNTTDTVEEQKLLIYMKENLKFN